MQTDNRFFDDFSKLANGAVGTLSGLGKEMEAMMRSRFERFIGGLDLVSREEFDAVKAMAEAARAENEALAARLAALEAKAGDKA
jgi:BMFP domain-containing protein YqiC